MSRIFEEPPEDERTTRLSLVSMTRGNWILLLLAVAFGTSLAMRGFFEGRTKTVPVEKLNSEEHPPSQ